MNLIIDIGNTRIKAGLFEQNEMKHSFVFDPVNPDQDATQALMASDLFDNYTIKHVIVASVVSNISLLINYLQKKTSTLVFSAETATPLFNLYKSAGTLGSDRLAAAVGAHSLFPESDLLVIDAGTCIKYNFINSKAEYLGGAISPGLKMRFKALHTFTSRLPLVEADEQFDTLIGTTTTESVLSGVEKGAAAEIDGFIEQYQVLYPAIKIVLTGGDANFFEKRLKNTIFTDSFLILKGLNSILNYNLKASE
ncbi:MAG: type III pantothenate kinase [Bacteroidota bacterium]